MSQRHALIRATGAYRTTSAQALTVLTGNLPINLECERRSFLFKIRKGISFELENLRFEGNEHDLNYRTHQALARRKVLDSLIRKWQLIWDSSDKGRQTYLYLLRIDLRVKSKWLEPTRWSAQFITGHGSFQSFRKRFALNDSDLCTCGEPDSP